MNSRVFTCILCPNGCEIEVCHEDGRVLETEGNKCKKGQQYVIPGGPSLPLSA